MAASVKVSCVKWRCFMCQAPVDWRAARPDRPRAPRARRQPLLASAAPLAMSRRARLAHRRPVTSPTPCHRPRQHDPSDQTEPGRLCIPVYIFEPSLHEPIELHHDLFSLPVVRSGIPCRVPASIALCPPAACSRLPRRRMCSSGCRGRVGKESTKKERRLPAFPTGLPHPARTQA